MGRPALFAKKKASNALSLRGARFNDGPLEGREGRVVHLDVRLAEGVHGGLLRLPDAAVLERREDGRRDVLVVHALEGPAVDAAGEQAPRRDSDL